MQADIILGQGMGHSQFPLFAWRFSGDENRSKWSLPQCGSPLLLAFK
jgi:hypothetical protein